MFSRGLLRKLSPAHCIRGFSTRPTLNVSVRERTNIGSTKSRTQRKEGRIPGVLYGVDDDKNELKTLILVDQKSLARELREKGSTFENTVYELNVESEAYSMKVLATPRQTQFNPITDLPMSVNFLRFRPSNRLRIPVTYVNADQSQDLKRGSYVIRINQFVEVLCEDADAVPESLVVDLSTAQKGDVIRLRDIALPAKIRPFKSTAGDDVLCVVKSARSK